MTTAVDEGLTLAQAKDRAKELRRVIGEKVAENEQILGSVKGTGEDGNPLVIEEGQRKSFAENLYGKGGTREDPKPDGIKGLQDELADLEEHIRIAEWGEAPKRGAVAPVAQGPGGFVMPQGKTLGEAFTDSEAFKAMVESGKRTMDTPWDLAVPDLAGFWRGGKKLSGKDVYTDLPGGTPGSFAPVQRDPIVERQQRTVRVRDLFPVVTTTSGVIEYFRVTGFTNNASTVGERDGASFAAKPQSTLAFDGEQAPVRTIAHWEAAHRSVLADVPQLRGIIDNELLYGLRLEEDNQILNGSGSGNDLTGILNTSGIQQYSWSSGETGDNKGDAIRRAITQALLSYYDPTGVVVHDGDHEDIELTKDSNGQYLFAVSMQLGGEPRIWRRPLVPTPAISEGTALVGAFGIGATLYDREEANIRVAEQHEDFFVRNAIVVLAEQRLALATKRPESFVEVTFDSAPA